MKAEIFENERAAGYDHFVTLWIPAYEFFLKMLPAAIQTGLHPYPLEIPKILVAGCGTGNEIKTILDSDIRCEITGVDPSPEMIALAENKLGEVPDVQLIHGLPLKAEFHIATLILVLHFLRDDGDKLMLLTGLYDRMKPGAKLIVLDIFGNETEITTNLYLLANYLTERVDAASIVERIDRIKNKIQYIDENRFTELCKEAGFSKPVRIHQSMIYGGWLIAKPQF